MCWKPKGVPVLQRDKKQKKLKWPQYNNKTANKSSGWNGISSLITGELHRINPWWFISFHYRDHHGKEDQLLGDVADLKRKLHRIIFKSRDKTIKGAGEYPYPRMLFFHETSHQGTGQFHTHLIVEKMPPSLNTQYEMETLFHKRLPHKVKALPK